MRKEKIATMHVPRADYSSRSLMCTFDHKGLLP
jgi:hypothetical protein